MKRQLRTTFTFLLATQLTLSAQTSPSWLSRTDFLSLPLGQSLTWRPSSPASGLPALLWREQPSSFAALGIKTYIAYHDGQAVGSLAIHARGEVSGQVTWGHSYQVTFSPQGELQLRPLALQPDATCALEDAPSPSIHHQARGLMDTPESKPELSDGYFREYRLAVLFCKESLETPRFNRSPDKLNAFLAELEAYLNAFYVRDLGIRFTMVKDERLFARHLSVAQVSHNEATAKLNELIGPESYDAGLVLAYAGEEANLSIAGIARLGGINHASLKGAVRVSELSPSTIGHELGHLFGAKHSFGVLRGFDTGIGAEPGRGQSIMSYGATYAGPFFGLPNITEIRACIRSGEYSSIRATRHQAPGNTPPLINQSKMKREYIVPRNTFFSIPVYATDPEQKTLYYACNQDGYTSYSSASFIPLSPQTEPVLEFHRRYSTGGALMTETNTLPTGEYKLVIAVSDALPTEEAISKRQAPLYDTYATTVRVVQVDKPFKMTEGLKSSYKAGEKFTLRWDVDETFFKDKKSKVRVLLSDDKGKTFKHILVPETANDGECEVILPQTAIGWEYTYGITLPGGKYQGILSMNKGLLRLEVIDEGIFDLSPNKPYGDDTAREGIAVTASTIQFAGLPSEQIIQVKPHEALPEKPSITASASGRQLAVSYSETQEGRVTRRLWSATNQDEVAHYAQYILRDTLDQAPEEEAPVPVEPTPEEPAPTPEKPSPTPAEEQPAPPQKEAETPRPKEEQDTPPSAEAERPTPPAETNKPKEENSRPPQASEEPTSPKTTPVDEAVVHGQVSVKCIGGQILLEGTKDKQLISLWDLTGTLLARHQAQTGRTILSFPERAHLVILQVGKQVFKLSRP